ARTGLRSRREGGIESRRTCGIERSLRFASRIGRAGVGASFSRAASFESRMNARHAAAVADGRVFSVNVSVQVESILFMVRADNSMSHLECLYCAGGMRASPAVCPSAP